ncbi:MAG: hypothetical protein Tsb002_07330 [Wenzhouxiangellaceae bacterium]
MVNQSQLSAVLSILLLLASGMAFAATMNANVAPYNTGTSIIGVTVTDTIPVRESALSQAVGMYRTMHGQLSLNPPAIFIMIYQDGSWETGKVTQLVGTITAVPVPGTQHPPPPGGSSGGSSGSGGGGGDPGTSPGPSPIDPPSGGGGGGFPCTWIVTPDGGACILIQGIEPSDKASSS